MSLMAHILIQRTASISACGRYRYELTRDWAPGNRLAFVMFNPSTADAEMDDPTVRRCMAFARREGYGGITIANVYAFRAKKPADLFKAEDPFGPDNEETLRRLATDFDVIVCAWGSLGAPNSVVTAYLRSGRAVLKCLGRTKDGHPRHPLYVRGDQPLLAFA